LTGLLNQNSGQSGPFGLNQDLSIFTITFPETLNTKLAINELSFPLVTHMAYSDARFDSYGILKSGRGAENFLDRLGRPANDNVLRAEDARILTRVGYKFRRLLTQLSNAYSHAHFW
jgi:hypothetical protein